VGAWAPPLLWPERERVDRWRARLPEGPKLGLAWQGNPRYAGEPWRSMPCAYFRPLFELGKVSFISLQKHFGREQLTQANPPLPVLDLADTLDADGDAFVDSLAVLALVRLFVTTDTALAHVAGSAGVRTWLLLPHVADWRWGTEPERTAWYPSVRLFRQSAWGDWDGVIRRVLAELETELATGAAPLLS